jgi:hypothetical protein
MTASTDASDHSWGLCINLPEGPLKTSGHFPLELAKRHINFKELLTVRYLLEIGGDKLAGQVLEVGIDSMVALSYVNKLGGRIGPMAKLADEIYALCRRFSLTLQGVYVPSAQNTTADSLSRRRQSTAEWQLNPKAFRLLEDRWGPHSIDLFSTLENSQVERFASWTPQPGAAWTDSMAHPWDQERNAYANPPTMLIQNILKKITTENTTLTLVAPLWWSKVWLVELARLAVDLPLFLPNLGNRLCLRHSTNQLPTSSPPWRILAWRISGNVGKQEIFAKKLKTKWGDYGPQKLLKVMRPPGCRGRPTAAHMDVIHLIARQRTTTPG